MTLSTAVSQWLESYKKTSVKEATYNRLLISNTLMNKYPIAAIEVDELTAEDLQDYINALVNDGYAQTTIKKQYNLLSAYIRYSNASGVIARPLYAAVRLPAATSVKKQKKSIAAYTDVQQTMLKSVLNTNQKAGYKIAAFMLETGIRVGEALSLTWFDIQWQRRAVLIDKTLVNPDSIKHQFVQNSPKSFSSRRLIPLSKAALDILSSIPRTGTYIFNPDSTEPFSYKALRKHVKAACQEAKVPYLGMHVFRHTFATNCYYKGCDVKILSKLLGHSSVTVTYNTYIHLFGDALEEMRAILD